MQTSSTRHVAAFAAALALALVPATASAVLERVGPNRPDNFLPAWYQDTTGLAMEFCTPQTQAELDGGWCLILPADVPGGLAPEVFPNAFSGEHFYWASDVVGDWQYTIPAGPGQTPITISSGVLLVQAIEAAFLGDIGPGLGQVFGRIRVRVLDLPLTGIYKFYTPWGIKEIAGLAGDRIFDTEDIGINCPPFQYDCALATSIGPFLVPSNTPGGAELPPVAGPSGGFFLSDPARVGPVTGSPVAAPYNLAPVGQYSQTAGVPTNPNVYAIEAPDGQVIFKSHDFATVGRVWNNVIPGRVKSDRASYARDPGGAIQLHAFATGEPTVAPRLPAAPPSVATQPALHLFSAPCTGTVDPTGNLLPPYGAPVGETSVPMSRNGNLYFASTAPAAVPAGVCVMDANARTAQGVVQPTYSLGSVTDQVFVTAAVYDPSNGGSLSVRASSSDQFAPPLLSVGAFGTMTANVPLTNDLAYVTPLAAPPEHVRVHSQEGGTAELLVRVGGRAASGVTLTADKGSPQAPGTSVVFRAQGQGATEYLYRFWLQGAGAPVLVQDWSSSDAWALPSTLGEGTYEVTADVWSGLSPTSPDATSLPVSITLRYPAATGLTLAAAPGPTALAGNPVAFVATASGSTNYKYRFSLSIAGGPFTEVRAYDASSSWIMPNTTPVGTHTVRVEVVTSALASGPDQVTDLAYTLRNAPATAVSIVQDLPNPVTFGSPVTYTASATGPAGAPYQYRFLTSSDGGTTWAQARAYDPSPSWTTSGAAAVGNWLVSVEVRTSPLVARDTVSLALLSRVIIPAATSVSIAQDLPNPIVFGTPVTFTATAVGPAGAAFQYRFLTSSDGGATWSQARAYNSSPTWITSGTAPVGPWLVAAEVRTSSLVARDAISPAVLSQIVVPPATSVALTQSTPNPIALGTPVTYTAAPTGPAGATYQFRFLVSSDSGATWAVGRPYGSSPTWTTSGTAASGNWLVAVEVRTSVSVSRDALSLPLLAIIAPFGPATAVTLTQDPGPSVAFGTPVTYTAVGTGPAGATIQYRFITSSDNGVTWQQATAYSTSGLWVTSGLAARGNWLVAVEARTSNLVQRDVVSASLASVIF